MDKGTFFTGQPVFTQFLKYLPKATISQHAHSLQADRYCKKFYSYEHLVVMLFSSFQKCNSIRELTTGLLAWQDRLHHLGLKGAPKRSTLSEANLRRSSTFFERVYYSLLEKHRDKFLPDSRSKNRNNRLYLMDSTTFELFSDIMSGAGAIAKNGKRKGGVKAHLVLNESHQLPELCYLSEAKENDRVLMEKVNLPAGSILVFDKGYTTYAQWQRWTEKNITWVTRMNTNAYYRSVQKMSVTEAQKKQGVISDEYILLGRGTFKATEVIPARRIVYLDQATQRTFVFITNNEKLKPASIAALYKRRWSIETHFKAVKQNFQLKYFLGDNANAIQIQIWCALIAELLIRLVIALSIKRKWSFSNLCALVRMHLGTYVNLLAFLTSPERALKNQYKDRSAQMAMQFSSA